MWIGANSQRCCYQTGGGGLSNQGKGRAIYHLNLTGKGQQVYQESHQLFFDWDRLRLSALTEEERHTLFQLLQKISCQEEDIHHV